MTFTGVGPLPPFTNETHRVAYSEPYEGYLDRGHPRRRRGDQHRDPRGATACVHLELGVNPDGCHPDVRSAAADLLSGSQALYYLSHYPDRHGDRAVRLLGDRLDIPPEWILWCAGLEQAIALIASASISSGDSALVLEPGFFLFREYSRRMGARVLGLGLDEASGFEFDDHALARLAELVRTGRPKLCWIANPNNPSGRHIPLDRIRAILDLARSCGAYVVVDEAHGEYLEGEGPEPTGVVGLRAAGERAGGRRGPISACAFLGEYENLVVLRTFSKAWGLAGIRIAAAVSSNESIRRGLRDGQLNYPVGRMAFELATVAMERPEWLDLTRERAARRRLALAGLLDTLPDFDRVPSSCGIQMLRWRGHGSGAFMDALRWQDILVGRVAPGPAVSDGWIRLNYGADLEMELLAGALRGIAAGGAGGRR